MRIGLFIYHPFHANLLAPLHRILKHDHDCLLTPIQKDLVDFSPDVLILSEAIAGKLRKVMPHTLFVHTRHGLASKNVTYSGCSESDFLCGTSPFVKQWYLDAGVKPRRDFWITGYIQMDPLFRRACPRPSVLASDGRTILYAPTYNVRMSSAPMLGERIADLIRAGSGPDVNIVVKPHPNIIWHTPQWMDMWRAIAAKDKRFHVIDDLAADVMPYLQSADVLISDASSVSLEFLAMDRPIIQISNPERVGYEHYDPKGFEWKWRDMGEDLSDVNQLPDAVRRALEGPDTFAERRAHYRQLLFGDLTDGYSAERLCQNVSTLRAEVPRRGIAATSIKHLRDMRRRARLAARRVRSLLECATAGQAVAGRKA